MPLVAINLFIAGFAFGLSLSSAQFGVFYFMLGLVNLVVCLRKRQIQKQNSQQRTTLVLLRESKHARQ